LCGHCRHADRIVSSRGTVFYLCRRSFTDHTFPAYPAAGGGRSDTK
jgi:hypothetical protein